MGTSTGTRNFGIRRFTNLVRESRYRAPAATELRLGIAVEPDPGNSDDPQTVREVAAGGSIDNTLGGAGILGLVGILWYEHDSQTYEGAAAGNLLQDYDTAPAGRMVQVLHGAGAKVWFRNTELDTTEPGLNFPASRAAVTMVTNLGPDGTGDLASDVLLAWDDSVSEFAVTAVAVEAICRTTYVDNDLGVCDAELLI
jgi:hypothetical protein